MGIQVEFNPDLALRDIREHKEGRRTLEECIPELLEEGKSVWNSCYTRRPTSKRKEVNIEFHIMIYRVTHRLIEAIRLRSGETKV